MQTLLALRTRLSNTFRDSLAALNHGPVARPAAIARRCWHVAVRTSAAFWRCWYQQDRIRIPKSEGRLLRLQVGDRLLIEDELWTVTESSHRRHSAAGDWSCRLVALDPKPGKAATLQGGFQGPGKPASVFLITPPFAKELPEDAVQVAGRGPRC